jgi:hypothetical protein
MCRDICYANTDHFQNIDIVLSQFENDLPRQHY